MCIMTFTVPLHLDKVQTEGAISLMETVIVMSSFPNVQLLIGCYHSYPNASFHRHNLVHRSNMANSDHLMLVE